MRVIIRFLPIALLLVGISSYADTPASSDYPGRLANFVRGSWEHGVPYAEARAFGPDALPYLRTWLKADALQEWSTIVWMIGYIGQPEDFATLRDFLENRFSGEVDGPTFDALLSAIHVMGHIAVSSDEAMSYLRSATNPSFFQNIRWTHDTSDVQDLRVLLSKLAINALSSTGRPEAERTLKDLQNKPYDPRQRDNVSEGLARHKAIVAKGRLQYFESFGLSTGPSEENK